MHNRNMIWHTADGRLIPIKDLTSAHLTNVLNHINENIYVFIARYGERRIEKVKYNITQEIRMRKLNRIETDNNQENLF